MNKKSSILYGISIGTIISLIGVFYYAGNESTISFSAFLTGIAVGYLIEDKPLKFGAIAVLIQQIIATGIRFFSDPDSNLILSYPAIAGLMFTYLFFVILFNVLIGILGSFIGSIAKKYRV
ncbi:MAG: hypothetical protein SCH70_13530 [Candidatus Methanoperedens sp.]|nr:hypothetical protein [Candidatus Methanoperedens sp.]